MSAIGLQMRRIGEPERQLETHPLPAMASDGPDGNG